MHRAVPGHSIRGTLRDGSDVVVPDLAGWRRETLPELPDAAFIDVAPDWVCEVLSPSTERLDRIQKMRVFARSRVAHVWLINPALRTVEVYALEGQRYAVAQTFEGDETVRAVPFDAIAYGATTRPPRTHAAARW